MDPLYELLAPYFDGLDDPQSLQRRAPSTAHEQTARYLARLSTLSLPELTSTEPAALLQSAQSHLRNLQALSKRSHKAVISSTSSLADLSSLLPALQSQSNELHGDLPELERAAVDFASKYDRTTENEVLDRRKRMLLLSRNVDRVTDVLDLPSLLSSAVASAQSAPTVGSSMSATSYAMALDLHAHIKRLNTLYPQSDVVGDLAVQAEAEMQNLTAILITSLQSPSLKLAGAMRTIGWLRRVAPDLADDGQTALPAPSGVPKPMGAGSSSANTDGALGALFLVCRLQTLQATLDALEPLRELADQETIRRKQGINTKLLKQQVSASALGSQSERYVKRYIEIFREQSFGIVSMHKSIFPSGLPAYEEALGHSTVDRAGVAGTASPSPLSSFTLHLVGILTATLREYMPNIKDTQARESLMTQVLYCAGSLGRLGADFGMMIALLEDDDNNGAELSDDVSAEADADEQSDPEWVGVMKKHRVQASRLEVLARGVGGARKTSGSQQEATPASSPA